MSADTSTRLRPLALRAAAQRFGTPLYVYDLGGVAARYQALADVLPPRFTVHYALKANGSLAVGTRLAALGCGVDVCSLGELAIAAAAGFDAGHTLFTGPGKSDRELHEAVTRGVRWIVVESIGEARRLNAIAAELRVRQPVLARIAPRSLPSGDGLVVAATGHKFGIDEAAAAATLADVAGMPALRLEGIHVYAESCVVDAERLLAINRRTIEIAQELASRGLPISVVDLGGGMGVAYSSDDRPFDLPRYADGLGRLTADVPTDWRFLIEPGRFLVAEQGAFVVTTLDVKTSSTRRHVIVDGGIHHLYRPNMTHANRQVEVLAGNGPRSMVTIAGPLLSGDDVLVEDIELPTIAVGDCLAFRACGAYGFSHSLMGFSAHPTPAEVAIEDDGTMWVMRHRGSPSAVLRDQVAAPPWTDESVTTASVRGAMT